MHPDPKNESEYSQTAENAKTIAGMVFVLAGFGVVAWTQVGHGALHMALAGVFVLCGVATATVMWRYRRRR